MPLSVRAQGDVSIIALTGVFTPGHAPSELGQALGRLLDEGARKIVLDLAAVSFLDSAGLGDLIAWKKRTVQLGGDIRLLRPTGKVRDMLVMLSLTRIFRVFDDESAALASFVG